MATAELNGTEHETEATIETPAPAPAPVESEADETLREIREMTAEIEEASADHYRKNESAKAAKKRVESLTADLIAFIRKSNEKLPLFDGKPVPPPPAEAPAEDQSWREVPIDTLSLECGLSESIVNKLVEAEITTIGKLADWTKSEKRLTDIAGIGGAKAEAIEGAMDKFWGARPVAETSANAEADSLDDAECGMADDADEGDDDEEAA